MNRFHALYIAPVYLVIKSSSSGVGPLFNLAVCPKCMFSSFNARIPVRKPSNPLCNAAVLPDSVAQAMS